jgi:ribosomal protein L37E
MTRAERERALRNGGPHAPRCVCPKCGTRRDAYAEEVEFLRSCGLGDGEILRRLNTTATALSRALYRADRPDLARPFERIARGSRRNGTCRDCGTATNRVSSVRCVPCGYTYRESRRAA